MKAIKELGERVKHVGIGISLVGFGGYLLKSLSHLGISEQALLNITGLGAVMALSGWSLSKLLSLPSKK